MYINIMYINIYMFSNIINLRGGARPYLTDDQHTYYMSGIRQLYSITETGRYPDNYHTIIRDYIDLLYEFTRRTIIDFIDELNPVVLQKYFMYFNRIRDIQVDYTIVNLNLKSLQCILLITLLMLEGKDIENEKQHMLKFFPNVKEDILNILFYLLKNEDWLDINTVRNIIKSHTFFSQLLYEGTDKIFICVLLGNLTIDDIVETIANKILLIGIVTDKTWADNFHLYPFHFMSHDLIHSYTITKTDSLNVPFIKEFINYVNIKYKQDKYTLKQITIILFIILHEGINTDPMNLLYYALNHFEILTVDDIKRYIMEFTFLSKWTNPYFYAGFIDEPYSITLEEYKSFPEYYRSSPTGYSFIRTYNEKILADTEINPVIKDKLRYIINYINSCIEITQKELEYFYFHSPFSQEIISKDSRYILALEKQSRERQLRERLLRESQERERLERQRQEIESAEKERQMRERTERARLERARLERERLERARLERERLERARQTREEYSNVIDKPNYIIYKNNPNLFD